MDYNHQKSSRKLVFSGEKVKAYFHRNGISYKVAAAKLGIDKNTVAKLVKGGNMNVDIILKFCNVFGLNVTDFFKCEVVDEAGNVESYYLSSGTSMADESKVSEEFFNYKKCENEPASMDALLAMLEQNNRMLKKLSEEHKDL